MNWKSEGKVTYRWYWRLLWSFLKLALCQEFTFCNFQSHMAQLNRIHGDLYSLAFGCQAPHRRPKLQLWDDILHNNSHGGIIRVCMGIFTTALRNKKYVKFSKKKNLTLLPQCVACYLTAYFDEKSPFKRVVYFEVFNVHKKSPRLNTPFPNAWSEKRKIQAQNDRAPTNPTQNPSTYTVVSLKFTRNSIFPVQLTLSRSLLKKFPV